MWDKIGDFLNYPETWCSFIIKLVLLVFTTFLVVFILIAPILVYAGDGLTTEFYYVSILSGCVYYGCHLIAKELFDWYKSFWDKLPSCLKINWNRGE